MSMKYLIIVLKALSLKKMFQFLILTSFTTLIMADTTIVTETPVCT